MCGRLACTLCPDDIVSIVHRDINKSSTENDPRDIAEPLWLNKEFEYTPIYNAAPTTIVPVMIHSQAYSDNSKNSLPSESDYSIIPMKWGIVLHNKPASVSSSFHTHNARLENVLNSHLYKGFITVGQRCVILADGYYEWKTTKGEHFKQPYYFYQKPFGEESKEKHLIKLAGLYNTLPSENGVKHSCTILTKEADTSLAWMHHRMPVILNTPEDISNWLNSKEISYTDALQLLPDYSNVPEQYKLQYHAVDKMFINKSSCDSEMCMEPINLKKRKQNTLDNWLAKKK